MKKFLLLCLALMMMVTVFTGCGPITVTQNPPTQAPSSQSTTKAETTPTPDAPKPITFTMYSVETDAYPDTDFSSPVAKKY